MFEKFGEFDSAEELNKRAEELKKADDMEGLKGLAEENGLDPEDAEDYMAGYMEQFASVLMAATGKLKVEEKDLQMDGILKDWAGAVAALCTEDERIAKAVRKKGKSLAECTAKLIAFAFESKVQVSEKIVKLTTVKHNGKDEPFRGPLYLGIPSAAKVKELAREYYLEG